MDDNTRMIYEYKLKFIHDVISGNISMYEFIDDIITAIESKGYPKLSVDGSDESYHYILSMKNSCFTREYIQHIEDKLKV